MIIDQNLVLYEGRVATSTGEAIALNSLLIPGKAEPILITTRFMENLAGATNVSLVLQQAETQTGSYTDVSGTAVSISAADFKVGKRMAWRFLPRSVVNPWLRVKLTVTGTATAGSLFCAVMGFEDEPYEAGQYIDKGIVEG